MNTKKEANVILVDIDRRYVQLCSGSDNFNSLPLLLTELQLHLSLQVYAISTRAMASSSGLVMTWRRWWRYHINISILHSELMFWCCFQIYLPALKGYVPDDMIHALRAFLDFCYLARSDVLNTQSLAAMQDALDQFHQYCKIFCMCGVCSSFNLPHQHSLTHFIQMIWAFGAPNGLRSSIMEWKHIKAVTKPYWRSSHYEALSQMLLINQCLNKLAAAWVDFQRHVMLNGTCLSHALQLVHQLGKFNAHSNSYHTDQSIL